MIKSWFKKFIFKRKNKGIIVIASIIVLIAVYKIAREAIRDYNTQNNFDIVSTENSINDTDNITSNKSKENDKEVAQEEGKQDESMQDELIQDEEIEVSKDENKKDSIKNKIYIYVSGEVNNPGVVILDEGSRIIDAIDSAGGITQNANITKINLAYVLEDGTKVNVPSNKDLKNDSSFDYITRSPGDGNEEEKSSIKDEGQKSSSKINSKVNINTATQTELETLPGIGPSLALKIINYRKENDDLENIKNEIEKTNVKFLAVKGDVTDIDSTQQMVNDIIKEYGKIDVLVNNAGITKDTLLVRMKKEEFEDVIDVNLIGTFNITKNVIPYMIKQRKGRIINISSVVGISGNAGQTNYSASKAGIIGFTKSLAKEVGSRNILVNAVAPGFIETQMTDILKDEVKEEISKKIPLKRMGTVEDVANVVKFLTSEDSSYITGQVIQVDGGMY